MTRVNYVGVDVSQKTLFYFSLTDFQTCCQKELLKSNSHCQKYSFFIIELFAFLLLTYFENFNF